MDICLKWPNKYIQATNRTYGNMTHGALQRQTVIALWAFLKQKYRVISTAFFYQKRATVLNMEFRLSCCVCAMTWCTAFWHARWMISPCPLLTSAWTHSMMQRRRGWLSGHTVRLDRSSRRPRWSCQMQCVAGRRVPVQTDDSVLVVHSARRADFNITAQHQLM